MVSHTETTVIKIVPRAMPDCGTDSFTEMMRQQPLVCKDSVRLVAAVYVCSTRSLSGDARRCLLRSAAW